MTDTIIASRRVLVEDGPRSVVHFVAGCNPDDFVGNYEFWTVRNTAARFYGRWPEGKGDAGARAREMEGKPAYAKHWAIAETAILVQPTTVEDVVAWLNSHPGDAPYATRATINGQPMTVVKRDGQYDLEPTSISE